MVLYFSGTGNSEYVAKRIGEQTEDTVLNLFEKIKSSDFSEINSDSPFVVVAPAYAWRIPRILHSWLEKTKLSGNKNIYFVVTCGGSIGNAGKYLKKLCKNRDMHYMGCTPILMPENYIAMFPVPTIEEGEKIIDNGEGDILKTIDVIKNGDKFTEMPLTFKDKMNSGIVNDAFYPFYVHAKKFYAEDTCITCGKCVELCPLSNIAMENQKPKWGKNCTHCMACICKCPTEAIEYGNNSKDKTRYVCPR